MSIVGISGVQPRPALLALGFLLLGERPVLGLLLDLAEQSKGFPDHVHVRERAARVLGADLQPRDDLPLLRPRHVRRRAHEPDPPQLRHPLVRHQGGTYDRGRVEHVCISKLRGSLSAVATSIFATKKSPNILCSACSRSRRFTHFAPL